MTLAGRHIFDEHLLFSDVPCQIHRLGEQEELGLVRLDTANEVLFYFIPLCVKLARLVPAALLSSTAAASLPPCSAFIRCSTPVLGTGDAGGS